VSATPSRAEQIRQFLKSHDLQAWIGWRPDELLMLTGYYPFWGASLVMCFADGEPLVILPQIEPRDHIPAGLRVLDYPWGDLKCADPYAALVAAVEAELAKAGIKPAQAGMTAATARISLPIQAAEQIPISENFASRLAALGVRSDAAAIAGFAKLYLRKTAEEIQCIRLANQVANIGLHAFYEHLNAGVSEAEVGAAVESAIYRQIGFAGIFHSRGWAMIQSGPNSADAGRFNRSTGRRLEEGDLVVIELAACVNGYFSDLTRMGTVGTPEPEAEEVLTVVREAQQLAVNAIGPGVSAQEVDAAARDKIAAHGFAAYFTHHTGHHVGFRYHDPGFLIVPGEKSKLEPGMIVTIEPGAYIPERGAGARIEDDVLVTESGHDVLSAANGSKRG